MNRAFTDFYDRLESEQVIPQTSLWSYSSQEQTKRNSFVS